jgi:hypothetical protein
MLLTWKQTALAALTAVMIQPTAGASIQTITFFRVTSNNAENVASQFSVDLMDEAMAEMSFPAIDVASGDVLFVFRNVGPIDSAISEVFFDDGSLLSQSAVFNSLVGSTSFVGGSADPSNLPSGTNLDPDFVATEAFSADAQGNPSLGGNPGDVFGISFDLIGSLTFDDVVDALVDGSLRLGMHVRAIGAAGGSDSFANNEVPPPPDPQDVIPEMPSVVVWACLAGLCVYGTRKRLL